MGKIMKKQTLVLGWDFLRNGILGNVIESQLGVFLAEILKTPIYSSYTKPKGQLPDYSSPIVLHNEHTTIENFCNKLHRTIAKEFK